MAVITAAEARSIWLPDLTGTGDDTRLVELIAQADHALAAWCGYTPRSASARCTFESATYTEYMDGPGGRELLLPARPVTSITSIHDDPTLAYGSDTEVVSGDRTLYGSEGLVILDSDATHGAWSTSRRAIKAVYVAGWADTTAPTAIKQAVCMLVAHWWRLRVEAGRDSVSAGSTSVGTRGETIPPQVLQVIAPFRLPGSYCG